MPGAPRFRHEQVCRKLSDGLSPNAAAGRLGFSRHHVRRLVDAGELTGTRVPGSSGRQS
jgi:excisionase family DNA binding protein